ncbi:uncharacterized protein N7484_007186 [Penicillium longicatenatum]|uniref:uncharacterized protein n=1 Tax=Penicillium longicatenatum TaxID=1561947 RepID=UPI0025479ADE|nr:uncharacterized protein N7484_007186 [Penicillium longicatenatum]KAJ5639324.1 hypothetical protein N7484_007186 [Penicillium longicatenatum]
MSADPNPHRSKKACISCRQRKRRCDGGLPCAYCEANDHNCEYEQRKKIKRNSQKRSVSQDVAGLNKDDGESSALRLIEANSPAVFVRQLGLKINPASAPRLSCYAWNLGLDRETTTAPQSLRLTDILSLNQMYEYTTDYFLHVAPVYNFLDREYVDAAISKLWHNGSQDSRDSMLCGVAALGCLFGGKPGIHETRLVQCIRIALEQSSSLPCPEIDHVLGWLLRVIYLRATSTPQATWMACCTLMHMVETTRLHLEPSKTWILAQSGSPCPANLRRRIFWVAQLFNTWVSADCGKSQVELRGASTELPQEIWTKDQTQLCYMSCRLGRQFDFEPEELESLIADLCVLSPAQPMLQLLKCNIALCCFRRARALRRPLTDVSRGRILDLAKNTLSVVSNLVNLASPWWHVINIPFQIVCVCLVIDTDRSLCLLTEALEVLRKVTAQYDTGLTRESYDTACFLVTQERQKGLNKLEHLNNALKGRESAVDTGIGSEIMDVLATDQNLPLFSGPGLDPTLELNHSLADYFLLEKFFPPNDN